MRQQDDSRAQRGGRAARTAALIVPIAIVAMGAWVLLEVHGRGPSHARPAAGTSPPGTAGSAAEAAGDAASEAPRIEIPQTTYDFGTITQGERVSHTFAVRNTGNAPLKLIEAGAS
jgi:hypothetical protein